MSRKETISIIPRVSNFTLNNSLFTLTEKSTISVSTEKIMNKASLLKEYLSHPTGFPFPLSIGKGEGINLILQGIPHEEEAYKITINEAECSIISSTEKGLARGIQTLRQLLPPEIFSKEPVSGVKWTLPGCKITDSPRFRWRGMHLDVCRHFVPKEDVLRFIELIALYKFNKFHLHLTEDQGWRIEIKKYPKLTEIGSRREATQIGHALDRPKRYDDMVHSGFYNQDEIREIVAYAAIREITVVPEIDMPGHMQSAISAYPELGCTELTLKPLCHWGICQHILNVEESTIEFMKNVLTEVMDMFPGEYIHIGGDEAPKYEWEEQRRIQDRMIELGLKSEANLQSWFIGQMAQHIQSRGRTIIGWDEILEGGLAEGAVVMSWQGEEGGKEATSLGHKVIMTPQSHVYFDHYQGPEEEEPLTIGGFTPLEKVYEYEVIPLDMPEEQQKLVLGSQGQLWTEYMADFHRIEYMMFPRACALAENLWSEKDKKDFKHFLSRLKDQKVKLDYLKVNYHK